MTGKVHINKITALISRITVSNNVPFTSEHFDDQQDS